MYHTDTTGLSQHSIIPKKPLLLQDIYYYLQNFS